MVYLRLVERLNLLIVNSFDINGMKLKNQFFIFLVTVFISTVAIASDYVVGPSDTLDIVVYDNPDLSGSFDVSASGVISFPLAGEIKVVGNTPRQIENLISGKLVSGKYLKNPQVRVSVAQFKSQSVAVIGEVNNPGKVIIEGASTVLDLLAEVGGLTPNAGDKVILVKRKGGREKSLEIDISEFNRGDFSNNSSVESTDVLIVPKGQSFYIYGEIRNPGTYRLERDMTVMQALSVGGGLTQRGTQKGLVISRRKESGGVAEIKVKLTDNVEPDDVLYVKESIF